MNFLHFKTFKKQSPSLSGMRGRLEEGIRPRNIPIVNLHSFQRGRMRENGHIYSETINFRLNYNYSSNTRLKSFFLSVQFSWKCQELLILLQNLNVSKRIYQCNAPGRSICLTKGSCVVADGVHPLTLGWHLKSSHCVAKIKLKF